MPGSRLNATQASIIGMEIQSITDKHGCCKPQMLVKRAEPMDSPIHNQFTWDNDEAAEQYRIEQARNLIRSVRIVHVDMPAAEQPIIRAFMHVRASEKETKFDGPAYLPIVTVMNSAEYKEQVLAEAKERLKEWLSKYKDLSEYFGNVFPEAEKVLETLESENK